jgi:hypothetical protein
MPTPIPDDELFAFAERVKGKVVVITGASDLVASRASRDRLIKNTPSRRCERHWERGRADFCETRVGRGNFRPILYRLFALDIGLKS